MTDAAQAFRDRLENPEGFPDSCDGGDIGSPHSPSIWLLGIEPGWSIEDEALEAEDKPAPDPDFLLYSVEKQMTWPFNRNAFKLLAALNGENPRTYFEFARRVRPFEKGARGYLKGNLFPEPCHNVGDWDDVHRAATGFDTKADYQRWMRATRIPIIREWIGRCRPRLIICCGNSYISDFKAMVGVDGDIPAHEFFVGQYKKRMYVSTDGIAPIAVIPHLTGGLNGLNSYASIELAAAFIRQSLP